MSDNIDQLDEEFDVSREHFAKEMSLIILPWFYEEGSIGWETNLETELNTLREDMEV